jgi:ABC-type Fe3+ transport system permease subunit
VLACLYPLVALFLAIFIAYPLVNLLVQAVQVGNTISPSTLTRLLGDAHTRQVLINTLVLGLTVAVLGTILATLYAYAMTRVAMPWKGLWHFLALLPTISPPILMALSLILLYGRRGLVTNGIFGLQTTALYGYWGLVAAQILSYFPFAYLLLLNLFRGLDASLEEAASTMGANAGKTLATVSLPLLVPGLAGAVLLLFSYSFADLGNPLLLGGNYPVLSSEIYQTIIGMYDTQKGAALAVILLIPAVLMYFGHKHLAQRTAFASVGGRGAGRHPQNRHPAVRAGALILCGGCSLLILMQYGTVLMGATTRLFGVNNALTLKHFESVLTTSRNALVDTIGLGIVASLVSAAVGFLIAYFVARSRFPGRAGARLRVESSAGHSGHCHRPGLCAGVQSAAADPDRHRADHRRRVFRAVAAVRHPFGGRGARPGAQVPGRSVHQHGRDVGTDAVARAPATRAAGHPCRHGVLVHAKRDHVECRDLRGLAALVAGDARDPVADGSRRRRRSGGVEHHSRGHRPRGNPRRAAVDRSRLA